MDRRRRKTIKPSELSDEQVEEFVNSVDSDLEEDVSGDESAHEDDSDYVPDQISPEDDEAIERHLNQCRDSTNLFIDAINISLNLSDIPSASSTLIPTQVAAEEEVETSGEVEEAAVEPQPSSSSAATPARGRPPVPPAQQIWQSPIRTFYTAACILNKQMILVMLMSL